MDVLATVLYFIYVPEMDRVGSYLSYIISPNFRRIHCSLNKSNPALGNHSRLRGNSLANLKKKRRKEPCLECQKSGAIVMAQCL